LRILLISPPFYRILGFYNRYYPLAIVSIGTVLRKLGHKVLVYDADFTAAVRDINFDELSLRYSDYSESLKNYEHPVWREAIGIIDDFKPDMVGLTVYTTMAASAFHLAGLCKAVAPRCFTVMGGPHAAVKADEILRISADTDFVLRGEGEKNLPVLIDHLDRKLPLNGVPGLSFRHDGLPVHNPAAEPTRDLDNFPIPDRGLLMNESRYTPEDMGLIMSSRGCPYNCSYCASETRRVSYRSVNHVIGEIKEVKKRYGTFQFTFKDDSFPVDARRVKEFCARLIEERLKINWECNSRVNLLEASLVAAMKKAGCNFIKVGIESGSPRILKKMNKGITREQCLAASKLLRKTGIHWSGYFMMGVPGETEEDILATLRFMYELQPDLALLSVYEPFPGTAMFAEGIERGLVYKEMTLTQYYRLSPAHYFKTDPQIQTDCIPQKRYLELEKTLMDAFHAYNKELGRVFKMIRARTKSYLYQPRSFLDDIRKYLSY